MKPLPKHLRPRWRYLAVELEAWPDADLSRGDFQREVWYAAANLLGDPGSADADLTVLQFVFEDGAGETVVRVRRSHVERARAALACVSSVGDHPVGLRVAGVSGTVRGCVEKYCPRLASGDDGREREERYIGRRAGQLDQRSVVFGDARRTAFVRTDALDVRTPAGFVGTTELDFE